MDTTSRIAAFLAGALAQGRTTDGSAAPRMSFRRTLIRGQSNGRLGLPATIALVASGE